jgi:DNA-directed RNA polymerase beta' subunit
MKRSRPPSGDLRRVEFSIPSSAEIRDGISRIEITDATTAVVFGENGSLHDTRLGSFRNVPCGTCDEGGEGCAGHFGHIKLAAPVLNPMFIASILRPALLALCLACTSPARACVCIQEGPPNKKGGIVGERPRAPPSKVTMLVRNGGRGPHQGLKRSFMWTGGRAGAVSINDLHRLLLRVPPSVYQPLFPHLTQSIESSCFIKELLVLPTVARPPNLSGGEWRADAITRLYVDVLRTNQQLRMHIGTTFLQLVDEMHDELQGAVNVLFDTKLASSRLHESILTNGGIRQRIDGKEGRVRMNLMGKRCNYSARSVLSGDPCLGIDEVGIPTSVAQDLTVPVTMTDLNVDEFRLGRHQIRYVTKVTGERFDASLLYSHAVELNVGDVVERSLKNGDIVAVNRQPTLHRGSIIACYVRIFQCSTFRLNYSTMVTLNADTDGDEVNIHVPQCLESRAELEELMLASTNIVCSQNSAPLVGLTQDSLLGCFMLSRDKQVSRNDMMALLYAVDIDVDLWEKHYRGTAILEHLLTALNIELGVIEIPKSDFVLRNGVAERGTWDKAVVGVADNSLLHHVFLAHGHRVAGKLIHMLQKVASAYLDITGFSVGYGDCVVENMPELQHRKLDVYIRSEADRGNPPDEVMLSEATGLVTRLAPPEHVNADNNALLAMIQSGAKGSMVNFNQITRAVGQQTIGSGRVPCAMSHDTRTLPHFKPHDQGLESRGFIASSYAKGLKPSEFFFHAMSGRIGIIDTVCKTSETGALFRRVVKSTERLTVEDVGGGERIVKNAVTGNIVQFNYGEDNLDGTYLKKARAAGHIK